MCPYVRVGYCNFHKRETSRCSHVIIRHGSRHAASTFLSSQVFVGWLLSFPSTVTSVEMPINTDTSVVADSTLASSPPPAATPLIKRAAFTYGRRRGPIVDNPDSSISYQTTSSESRDRIYRTGPSDIDEEVPPSSEPDLDDENASLKDALPKFQFGWKAKLKEMDERDDFNVGILSASGSGDVPISSPTLIDQPLSPRREKASGSRTVPASPIEFDSLTQDIFGGSLSSLTASSSLPPSSFANSPASPGVVPARRRTNKRAVVHDSDSDSEIANSKPSSSLISPTVPHTIITPTLHSSQTPPTSDDDIPAQFASKSLSKGGNKATAAASRRSVPPLRFDGEPTGSHKKVSKDKESKKYRIKVSFLHARGTNNNWLMATCLSGSYQERSC